MIWIKVVKNIKLWQNISLFKFLLSIGPHFVYLSQVQTCTNKRQAVSKAHKGIPPDADKVAYSCNSRKTLKLNYLPFKGAEQKFITSCTSTYCIHPLCKISWKSIPWFKRSCADKVSYSCNSRNTLKLNYLPLKGAEQKFIPSCTSTYCVLPLCKISWKSIIWFRRSCADKVAYSCNSRKTLKLNYLPLKGAEQKIIASCTSTYCVLPLCKVSWKSIAWFRRSCADKVAYSCNSRKTLKLNYLPLKGAEQKLIASCTSTYCVLPLCKVSWKSIALFRRSCADKVSYSCNSRKTLKLNYLPLKGADQKIIASCTTTYCVLPLCKVSWKSIAWFRRSCADKVAYSCNSRKTLKLNYLPLNSAEQKLIASCTSTYCVLPLCKVSWKSIKGLRRSCADKKSGQTDRQTDRRTDRRDWFLYTPPKLRLTGGIINFLLV